MTAPDIISGRRPERHRLQRSAVFSPDGKFRYRLSRRWGPGNALPFVLLNPSTASAEIDDPTTRRCIGFARRLGYDAIELVNLYAFISTDPQGLRKAGYPVGPDNDGHIEDACRGAPQAVCAWGANAKGLHRPTEVLRMLKAWGVKPMALRVGAGGAPAHPLYLPYDQPLQEF